ncbi:MAG: gliding motility-associated C-terminal domain-containing protein [Crocinitomicaceae bacterium]|jgi:gliding motility-associated-like protein|nr:gliding motility-associated C-terminal domain-containing protein [Crocinitomicaceae bacterium]
MRTLTFAIILLINLTSLSQGSWDSLKFTNWHFNITSTGIHADPSNNFALSLTNNSYTPFSNEGCSSINSPITGQLLFYTDGISVVDKTHQQMPNGGGLHGDISSHNTGLTFPVPDSCNQYYIFSNNYKRESNSIGNIKYSIVDLNLPGNGNIANPLGNVTTKNILVASQVDEAMTVIAKSNSKNGWLLTTGQNNNVIKIFEITSTGINLHSTFTLPISYNNASTIRPNPSRTKVAITSMCECNPHVLLDFDAATGTLSNFFSIPGSIYGGSTVYWRGTIDCEWSASGNKLYFSRYRQSTTSGGKIYQYDMTNPGQSPILIHDVSPSVSDMAGELVRLPNDRIYFLSEGNSRLRYIDNIEGPASGVIISPPVLNNHYFGTAHVFPRFNNYHNFLINIPDTAQVFICEFPDSLDYFPSTLMDVDGDNLNYSYINLSNNFTSTNLPGQGLRIYPVNNSSLIQIGVAYSDDACYSRSDTMILEYIIDNAPIFFPQDTLSFCSGDSITLSIDSVASNVLWSNGDTTHQIIANTGGQYSVLVTYGNGCNYSDTVQLNEINLPNLNLGPDIHTCDSSFTLSVNQTYDSLLWSNNTSNSSVTVHSTDTLFATAYSLTCFSTDTIIIELYPQAPKFYQNDTVICPGNSVAISLPFSSDLSYLWSSGGTTFSESLSSQGPHWFEITTSNGCQFRDTFQITYYPSLSPQFLDSNKICFSEGMITIQNAGFDILWANGDTSSSISVDSSGWYVFDYTSPFGCTSTDSMHVEILDVEQYLNQIDTTLCHDGTLFYTVHDSVDHCIWENNSTSRDSVLSPEMNENIVLIFEAGCTLTDTIRIDEHPSIYNLSIDTLVCDTVIHIELPSELSYLSPQVDSTNTLSFYFDTVIPISYLDLFACTYTDTLVIDLESNPHLTIDSTFVFCTPGGYVSFLSDSPSFISNQPVADSVYISSTGTYTITSINSSNCQQSAKFKVNILDKANIDLSSQVGNCNQVPIVLGEYFPNTIYYWSTGDSTATIETYEEGWYVLEYLTCGRLFVESVFVGLSNSELMVYCPNSFSPNSDEFNNIFRPIFSDDPGSGYQMVIYNRWGERIFVTQDPFTGWDGTYKNVVQGNNLYHYEIRYLSPCNEKPIILRGQVLLLR